MINYMINFFKRLLRANFYVIDDTIIFFIIRKTSGRLFVFLSNLRALIHGFKGRFTYENKNYFIYNEPNKKNKSIKYKFSSRRRSPYYSYGLFARGQTLSKEYMFANINFVNGDVVIDCGANSGDLYLYFFFNNIEIKYIGVEPSLKDFNNLIYNVKNGKNINKALWNVSKEKIKFFINSEYADSSLIEIKNYNETCIIETITIDEISEDYSKIKFIKIDVEGAEPEVLEGLKKNYKKVEYISIDAGPERGLKKKNTIAEIINLMYEKNFQLISYNSSRCCLLFKNKNIKY